MHGLPQPRLHRDELALPRQIAKEDVDAIATYLAEHYGKK